MTLPNGTFNIQSTMHYRVFRRNPWISYEEYYEDILSMMQVKALRHKHKNNDNRKIEEILQDWCDKEREYDKYSPTTIKTTGR